MGNRACRIDIVTEKIRSKKAISDCIKRLQIDKGICQQQTVTSSHREKNRLIELTMYNKLNVKEKERVGP